MQREATTGRDGAYVLAELPAGEYTVMAESAGLSPSAQNVQVNVGLDTSANFDLTKVQKRQEELTVKEEALLVETTRDVLGEVVERRMVEDLQRTLTILILKIGVAARLLIASSTWAQSFRGSIRGTVTDPSGSVIAGATRDVSIHDRFLG